MFKIQLNLFIADTIARSKQNPFWSGVHYIEFVPKLTYFTSKIYSRVLEYSAVDSKVCQEASIGRRMSPEIIYHVYMIISKPLVDKSLQFVKEPTKKVGNNAVSVVCTNS